MQPVLDMHTHTYLSNCSHDKGATGESFVRKANEIGIRVLGITNHCWDDSVPGASVFYQTQNIEHVLQIRDQIPADTGNVKVFIGMETEFCGASGTLGMTEKGAAAFDYILIPHSHTHMKGFVMPPDAPYLKAKEEVGKKLREAFPFATDAQIEKWLGATVNSTVTRFYHDPDLAFLADFLCQSFRDLLRHPEVEKIRRTTPVFVAHPFLPCGYSDQEAETALSLIPDGTLSSLFAEMAEKEIGYDVSVNAFLRPDGTESAQHFRLLRLARKAGVKFTFGTDAHSLKGLDNAWKSAAIFEKEKMALSDLHPFFRPFVSLS